MLHVPGPSVLICGVRVLGGTGKEDSMKINTHWPPSPLSQILPLGALAFTWYFSQRKLVKG